MQLVSMLKSVSKAGKGINNATSKKIFIEFQLSLMLYILCHFLPSADG